MDNYDELKKLWQTGKISRTDPGVHGKNISDMMGKLKRFESKQFRINIAKSLIVVALIGMILFQIKAYLPRPAVFLGGGTVFFAIIWFLFVYWKKQFKLSRLDLERPMISFIDQAVFSLNEQKRIFRIYFPVFILLLLFGMNIIYLELFKTVAISKRLVFHGVFNLFCLLMAAGGLAIRRFRFRREYQPLIDELQEIRADLEG